LPRNTVELATDCSHTGRWHGWCVACGQRAESLSDLNGLPISVRIQSVRRESRLARTSRGSFLVKNEY
jgi:hypothetical protein